MSIIIPANSAVGSGGFEVANSVRFDDGSSSNFSDGSAPAGNRQKFTWSAWFKRSSVGATQILASSSYSGGDEGYLFLSGGGVLGWQSTNSGDGNLGTNMLWRDLSAWYHVVFSVDTTQSTATNRIKLYVNGSQYTWDNNTTQPNVNQSLYFNVGGSYNTYIGRRAGGDYFDGYMSEIVFIDNAQLAADSFGEFDSDSGVWKPLESVANLTFGTSGYYLNFQNSSALGTDVSGVGNTFTANNLAAIDQTTDTCTNNFCTMNPLDSYNSPTPSDGNTIINAGGSDKSLRSTIGISSGKWYWEVNTTANNSAYMGIVNASYRLNTGYELSVASTNSVIWEGNGGILLKNGSTVTSSYSGGTSTFGFAFDLDAGTLKLSQNGTFFNSGNAVVIGITADTYLPVFGPNGGGSPTEFKANFGNPAYAISSGNTDGNNRGNFEYAVPSGYLSLCTLNLSEALS